MLTPRQKYEVCRTKSGVAYFPFIDSQRSYIAVSTRNGNILAKWGDGSEQQITPLKNADVTPKVFHIYSANYTGDVQVVFRLGLGDVYSISFGWSYDNGGIYVLNIQDIKAFFAQFPNLYSVNFDIYSYNEFITVIKGDFSQLPNSVERVRFQNWEVKNRGVDQWLNFSNYSPDSKLKHFDYVGGFTNHGLKILGDISKIPPLCTFFKLPFVESGSSITYTAGKAWASSFDTLSIPLQLTTTELDNLLIDMDNSITTKIGAGVISLGGWRSSASDAAVASLQAKGFTVNVLRMIKILDLPFQNSFADSGEMGMTMVAGGTSNQPTFALSGRKAGEYCAVFNGSQSIKTTTNLPVNSDKVTVAFWMKTTQTTAAVVTELSESVNTNNAFGLINNNNASNRIDVINNNTGFNSVRLGITHSGSWINIAFVIDRNENATNEIKLYINGSLATVTKPFSTDNNGNFVNNILFIGQRAGSSAGFNGSLTKLKIYNYPLTAGEVSTLYNSEL